MNEIDIFKLGCALGFDIRGAELSDEINSLIIVNEKQKVIDGFNSNKVIAYNCKKDINIKRNSVAKHLKEYLEIKYNNNDKVVFANKNTDNVSCNIDVNLLLNNSIQSKLIKNKKIIKTLYK